jgi:hypothetical protein
VQQGLGDVLVEEQEGAMAAGGAGRRGKTRAGYVRRCFLGGGCEQELGHRKKKEGPRIYRSAEIWNLASRIEDAHRAGTRS